MSTSYQYIHEVTADPGPNTHSIMGLPVLQGFRTVTITQSPATRYLDSVACGGTGGVCMAFGTGLGHYVDTPYPEVAVTVDGGRTWHAWMYPMESSGAFPGAACANQTCLEAFVGGRSTAILAVTTTTLGGVDASLEGQSTPTNPISCPSVGWCASTVINANGISGLIISTDGGSTWKASLAGLPPGGPPDAFPAISCPSVEHCIIPIQLNPDAASHGSSQNNRRVPADLIPNAFAVTLNGGSTWSVASTSSPLGIVRSISCPEDANCWALANGYANTDLSGLVETSTAGRAGNALRDHAVRATSGLRPLPAGVLGDARSSPVGSDEGPGRDFTTYDGEDVGAAPGPTSDPGLSSLRRMYRPVRL